METISEFSDLISEDRELENKPKIEFYSGGEKNDLTTYSPGDHTIYINEDGNNWSVILKEQSTNTQKSGRIKIIKPERENDYEVQ